MEGSERLEFERLIFLAGCLAAAAQSFRDSAGLLTGCLTAAREEASLEVKVDLVDMDAEDFAERVSEGLVMAD